MIDADMPLLIWLGPFAVYAFTRLHRPASWARALALVAAALAGSIVIVFQYDAALRRMAVRQFESDAAAGQILFIDPPPPPRDWGWAFAGYLVALVVMYVALVIVERRTERAVSEG